MGVFDTLLKQVVANDAAAFASWILQAPVNDIEPVSIELPGEAIRADALFRARRDDGQECIVHIEFQGRRSRPPMPWRMLDYLARLAQQYRLPMRSAVIYLEHGAGSQDTGHHQFLGINGQPVLIWNYNVVHLWRLQADDILALQRPSLLPLVGYTRVPDPAKTMPQVVAAIRAVPEPEQQTQLLGQLLGLLQDEEVMAMTQQLLTKEDIEELKRFPFLWQSYQQQQEEARVEGERQQARSFILETLVVRFDPPTSAYLTVEQTLAEIGDVSQLASLFREALRAPDFATFVAVLPSDRA